MAFKMRGNPFKLGKIATKSAMKMKTSYKMKEAMAKMKSPMELKKDSPMDKYKSDAQRKAVHASKAERGMTMKKEAAMKMGHKSPAKTAKPDFPDIDGDGNTTESMKKAAADKKSGAKMKKKEPMTMIKEAMKMKKDPAMKLKKDPAMKLKKDPAMKLKKESMAKQTAKQKEKLPAGLVKEISKKYGKPETATAKERVKAEGSKVAGKKMTGTLKK